jgi:hypothetical protein
MKPLLPNHRIRHSATIYLISFIWTKWTEMDIGSNHVVVSASQKISDYNLVLESL